MFLLFGIRECGLSFEPHRHSPPPSLSFSLPRLFHVNKVLMKLLKWGGGVQGGAQPKCIPKYYEITVTDRGWEKRLVIDWLLFAPIVLFWVGSGEKEKKKFMGGK